MSIAELIANLLDKHDDERYIYLNTNGGSVDAGLKLINVIKDLENNDIKVHCIGDTVISMGFVIFQSCTTRYVLTYSSLMQHQMSLRGVSGKLQELNSYMSHINYIENELNNMQASRINMSLDDFENKISNDWWLTSVESVEQNVSDEIVSIKCMFPKEKEIVELNTIFGDILLHYMKCPQVSAPVKVVMKLTETDRDISDINSIINDNFVNIKNFNPNIKRHYDRFFDIINVFHF
jgi:ATP-dependent Clp protease protease subunit